MSEHEWCRDVPRDEAVRAAEDAAAVPAIQHRDLPDEVALLRASLTDILGRVVRLEGEMDAGEDEEAAPAAGGPESRGWLTAEERDSVDHAADIIEDMEDDDGSSLKPKADALRSLLARETPPRVKVPPKHAAWWELLLARDGQWRDAIRAAGVEVEG